MKKDLPENSEEKTEEVFPDWSNIDATSIYRAGSPEASSTKKPEELDKLVKETNNFFKIGLIMLAIFFIILIVSTYY